MIGGKLLPKEIGLLVQTNMQKGCRGWMNFPGEYGFHRCTWLPWKSLGIVLEKRDTFFLVLFGGLELWIEHYWLDVA